MSRLGCHGDQKLNPPRRGTQTLLAVVAHRGSRSLHQLTRERIRCWYGTVVYRARRTALCLRLRVHEHRSSR